MLFRSAGFAATEIYTMVDTLSLHDALPILGAELDDPSSTNPRNVHVEQQAALALCKIYSVLPTAGETVRDARTTPQDNGHVNGFWRRKVSATKGHR